MITESQAEALFNAGHVRKCRHAYFYVLDAPATLDDIMAKNGLKLAFSEWWDVYREREEWVMKESGHKHIVPIIRREECVAWGTIIWQKKIAVDSMMQPKNLKIESLDENGKWVPYIEENPLTDAPTVV